MIKCSFMFVHTSNEFTPPQTHSLLNNLRYNGTSKQLDTPADCEVMPTWPVDVRSEVTRLSLEPLDLLDELSHEDALATLHEDCGHERPRRDDHV